MEWDLNLAIKEESLWIYDVYYSLFNMNKKVMVLGETAEWFQRMNKKAGNFSRCDKETEEKVEVKGFSYEAIGDSARSMQPMPLDGWEDCNDNNITCSGDAWDNVRKTGPFPL